MRVEICVIKYITLTRTCKNTSTKHLSLVSPVLFNLCSNAKNEIDVGVKYASSLREAILTAMSPSICHGWTLTHCSDH